MRVMAFVCLIVLMMACPVSATSVADVVGAAHWGGSYWFPSSQIWCFDSQSNIFLASTPCIAAGNTPTVDELNSGADRLLALGSRVIYVPLNPNPRSWYHFTNPPLSETITSHLSDPQNRLVAAAQMPVYDQLLHKPFTTFVLAIGVNVPLCADAAGHACDCSGSCTERYPYFGREGHIGTADYNWAPVLDGMTAAEHAAEKAAMKNLAAYLLSKAEFAGKTFILADVEGDWELREGHVGTSDHFTYQPDQGRVDAMRDWLNARQEGVAEARHENSTSPVRVFNDAEFTAVEWSMEATCTQGALIPPTSPGVCPHGATVVNNVLPHTRSSDMVCCDVYSYSFWDSSAPHQPEDFIARLDYLKSALHTTPSAKVVPDGGPFGHSNVIIAEYGGGQYADYGGDATAQKEGIRRLTETAMAWGSPLIAYWQFYDNSPQPVKDPNCPTTCVVSRPTNTGTPGGWIIPPDDSRPPIYTYFEGLLSLGAHRYGLRTYYGYYISPQNGGGGTVYANAPWLRGWEELTIIDRNGGSLMSGDSVNILTHDGHYLMAQNGGGDTVYASSTHDLSWEEFTVLKQNGTGAIEAGDTIALQASDGHYFVAEGGGGGTNALNANRVAIGAWEQFVLTAIPPTCSYALSPSQQTAAASGGAYSFTATTTTGCGWTATSNASWVTITSPPNGSGTTTMMYTVSANGGSARSTTIAFEGQSFTVTQPAMCTSFTVSPTSLTVSSGASSQTVSVAGSPVGCQQGAWSASTADQWIAASPASSSGSGSVALTFAQNMGAARSGSAVIAGTTINVTQSGAAASTCTSFTIAPTSVVVAGTSGSQPISLTGSPAGCQGGSWSASSSGQWMSVSPASGAGPGTVTLSWTSNSAGSPRSSTANIAGITLSTIQTIAPCSAGYHVRGDYNCDGRTDAAVYRPSNSRWYFANGESVPWGLPGDIAAFGDYDGDGATDIGVFRPSTGTWYVLQSGSATTRVVTFGQAGDQPAPADYDGDGKSDIAVFRPSTFVMYVLRSSDNGSLAYQFSEGGTPASADYDGDGKADPTIENPNNGHWYIIQSSNNVTRFVQWGGSGGDIPSPADYDGDGKADVTIESPCNGNWYTILSHNNATQVLVWGGSCGDQTAPGDYDGDGKIDIATFQECSSTLYIWQSTNNGTVLVPIGACGDVAVSSIRSRQ